MLCTGTREIQETAKACRVHLMDIGFKVIAMLRALRGAIAFAFAILLMYLSQNDGASKLNNFFETALTATKDPILGFAIHWLSGIDRGQLLSLALLAFLLGCIRWVEAIGLWLDKNFAKWMTLVSLLIYIPFEVNELIQKLTLGMGVILTINLLIVGYLFWKLFSKAMLLQRKLTFFK